MNKAKVIWGVGGVTIVMNDRNISLDYVDLICSFLRVDRETRMKIGDLVFNVLKQVGINK